MKTICITVIICTIVICTTIVIVLKNKYEKDVCKQINVKLQDIDIVLRSELNRLTDVDNLKSFRDIKETKTVLENISKMIEY